MDINLFEYILKEIRKTYTKEELNVTAFSVYNEPTLDPLFMDRLRMMTDMGFTHLCVTNGSNFTKKLVDTIAENKFNILQFFINLPTVSGEEARKIMGISSNYLEKVLERLDYLLKKINTTAIPVKITVNGNGSLDHKNTFLEVCKRFAYYGTEVTMLRVINRAGMLENIIQSKIDRGPHKDLTCRKQYFEHLYFGVKGNIYLCCHDYYQTYSYGNITEKPLRKLIDSDERKNTIKEFKRNFCRYCSASEVVQKNM
jgi:radical SAM protein with 4Fe4S-binding SPASM domain